ncbi:MAG: CAP domain-containing protein [Cellulomonas sp.]
MRMTGGGGLLLATAGVVGVGLLVLSGCASGGASVATPSAMQTASATHTLSPTDPVAYAAMLASETAAVRLAAGQSALLGSECAQAAALKRAADLVGAPELTHAPLTGVIAECGSVSVAAENLSRAPATPSDIVAAWMGSSGHRANLLDPELTQIGVGCVLDSGEMLCSQVFLGS